MLLIDPLDLIAPFIICLVILGVLVGVILINYKNEKNVFPLLVALIIVIGLNFIVGFLFFISL